jgi:hypothetical protein
MHKTRRNEARQPDSAAELGPEEVSDTDFLQQLRLDGGGRAGLVPAMCLPKAQLQH